MAELTDEQKLREIEKMCGKVALPGVPELSADELRQLQTQEQIVLVHMIARDGSTAPLALSVEQLEFGPRNWIGVNLEVDIEEVLTPP